MFVRSSLLFGFLIILTSCFTGYQTVEIPNEIVQHIQIYFCTVDDCNKVISDFILNSSKSYCALYSVSSEVVKKALNFKSTELITEKDNEEDSGLMHNKFCVVDDKVLTGSYNPVKRKMHNNLLVLQSRYLSQNYIDEFNEIKNKQSDKRVKYPKVYLNNNLIENYFCPEDKCQQKVINALENARKNISFMIFSFTDKEILAVLKKKIDQGIVVRGIFDSSQISKWSVSDELAENSIIKSSIHHKVFIIDDEVVITGSYNPTNNGNKNNDENLLIIHDKETANKFLEEFNRLTKN